MNEAKTWMPGSRPGMTKIESSRCLGRAPLRLDLAREQPAEIGQRRIRADRQQLIVWIGVEHLLLRLDDVLVLVETFLQRVPQRQRNVGIVDVEVVEIIPEEMRRRARLRRHELRIPV